MVSQTTRFDLDTYSAGEDNWSHTDTVQFVDENSIETDTLANRPSSGDYDDELFFATDVKILYRWEDGDSSWNAIAGLGDSSERVSETQYIDTVDALSVSSDALDVLSLENQDYNEATVTKSSASGTTDLDLSEANVFRVEAVDNITISFSNVTSTPGGNSVTVYIMDSDAAGPYTIDWPSGVVWSDGSVVDEVTEDGNIEVSLLTDDGGSEWRGRLSGENFA